jgi:hypothetical protein
VIFSGDVRSEFSESLSFGLLGTPSPNFIRIVLRGARNKQSFGMLAFNLLESNP